MTAFMGLPSIVETAHFTPGLVTAGTLVVTGTTGHGASRRATIPAKRMNRPAGRPGIVGETGGRLVLGLFALFVLVSLLTRWLSLVVEVLDMDEAAHAVGSWVLLDGGRLYTDFVDNKPPLLYGYYALAQLLLGRGLLPVHAVTAVVTVPLVALAASASFRHDRRGVAAGLLWLVYGASFLAHDMLADASFSRTLKERMGMTIVMCGDSRARSKGQDRHAGAVPHLRSNRNLGLEKASCGVEFDTQAFRGSNPLPRTNENSQHFLGQNVLFHGSVELFKGDDTPQMVLDQYHAHYRCCAPNQSRTRRRHPP